MRWTDWRLIASGNEWYADWVDHHGPACYELGTGGPRRGAILPHYVGETRSESARISCYARSGSHLSKTIDWHLRQRWCLYYRAIACSDKTSAKRLQDNLLGRFEYDWNTHRNGDR